MCRCTISWCDLDLTFDLAVVTLTFKIFLCYILEIIRYRKLILGREIGHGIVVHGHNGTLI